MVNLTEKIKSFAKNPVLVNSSWGGISLLVQGVLLSLYFILIARNYSTTIFANFLIANVLYQLISAFSTLGMSQWFIREITGVADKKKLVNKFFKIQLYSGIAFYGVNVLLGFLMYDDRQIQNLIIFFGINIVFDNLINAIKCINISEFKQKNTFVILSVEALLKFSVTCLLFIFPFSIVKLTIILVIIRFITLNLFLNLGSSRLVNMKLLIRENVSFRYIKTLLVLNWPFIIIGSISIINWRISTLIISKVLTRKDVADFEISFRIFSLAQMLPIVISSTVFPVFINFFKAGQRLEFAAFYRKMHVPYFIYGLFVFTFFYSFVDFILPFVFGPAYVDTGVYTAQMFLTVLIFPTAFLQANILISMKLEKMDMWFNIIILFLNLLFCTIGLFFFKSLTVINLSIFFSFTVFHILQDVILIRHKVSSFMHTLEFYGMTIFLVGSYVLLNRFFNPYGLFTTYWIIVASFFLFRNKFEWIMRMKLFLKSISGLPKEYTK